MEKESIFGKHVFSEEEKKKIAQQLAQAVSDKSEADDALKALARPRWLGVLFSVPRWLEILFSIFGKKQERGQA